MLGLVPGIVHLKACCFEEVGHLGEKEREERGEVRGKGIQIKQVWTQVRGDGERLLGGGGGEGEGRGVHQLPPSVYELGDDEWEGEEEGEIRHRGFKEGFHHHIYHQTTHNSMNQ